MRESIDIEALLGRAYREKQVDRLGGGAAGRGALGLIGAPKAPGAALGGGEKVDTSSYAARMAAEVREMFGRLANAPDALLTAHDAVLALPDFYIELTGGLGYRVWDRETARAMGQNIETPKGRSATLTPGRWVRELGEAGAAGEMKFVALGAPIEVHTVITAAMMVIRGRGLDRPYVSPLEIERWRSIRDDNGHAVERVPVYLIAPEHVAIERATYAVWHTALGMLREALADLPEYDVTGPHAEAEPWSEEPPVIVPSRTPRKSPPRKANSEKPRTGSVASG